MHRQQWAYFKICGFYLKLSLWCVVVLNFFIPHAHFTVSPTAFRCLRSSRGCISFSAFAPVNIWVISISKSTPSTRPNLSVVNLWMTQQLTARYCILDGSKCNQQSNQPPPSGDLYNVGVYTVKWQDWRQQYVLNLAENYPVVHVWNLDSVIYVK